MQRLEFSGAVRPIYGSLGVKRLICFFYMSEQRVFSFRRRVLSDRGEPELCAVEQELNYQSTLQHFSVIRGTSGELVTQPNETNLTLIPLTWRIG